MQEINGDPQFTTQGVYQQADDISPGPQEGQRGVPVPKLTPKKRQRGRKSVAERRGRDETRKKDRTGRKAKNAGQLRNPMEPLPHWARSREPDDSCGESNSVLGTPSLVLILVLV